MIKGSPLNKRKIILSLLFFSGITASLFSQPASIGGIINQYQRVVAIGGTTSVTVDDASVFSPGDTVLLIQMKGAIINVPESGSYGGYRESTGSTGGYEFLIVASVNTTTDVVDFTRDIINTYDVNGQVQLIRIPYYSTAAVTSKITCPAWDSTSRTGGVVALIVGGTLSLEADIDVAGLGFRGGTPFIGNGICTITDPVTYDRFVYADTYLNSGFKGEGLTIRAYVSDGNEPSVIPSYAKGKGANFTSGGGANGRFAGGGGGAGFGAGGTGGVEIITCGAGNQGGNGVGGRQVRYTDLAGRLLMGSGGGSSTYLAGATATAGGKGGGVVIIVCDTLKGNGHIITANGAKPSGSSAGNAGAGGGGGGGTVALYQKTFSKYLAYSGLNISANGGDGGNASNPFGEGGGGGGGAILTNDITFPSNVHTSVLPGAVGTRTGGSLGGTSGQDGMTFTTFVPVLNGFLFNSIVDSLTNNKTDSVCSDTRPPKILGTKPVGGSGSYTFTWQDSSSLTGTWTNIAGYVNRTDVQDYQPPVLAVTTSFRRIVYDNGAPPITDISKPVRITVHQAIANNNIGNPDTLCLNGDPPLIQQLLPDLIVPTSHVFYTWQDSSSAGTWGTSVSSAKQYDPAAPLANTTWYRRTVRSGSCVDSSAKVRMTVLPEIANNTIGSPQEICYGETFANLTGSTPPALTGGDNIYRYRWESSINGSAWSAADGTNNLSGYDPVEQPQRTPSNEYDYRRIVLSGNNDACADTSGTLHLRDFPPLSGNSISTGDLAVCSGFAPGIITGSLPANGTTTYTYTWQDSTNSTTQWQNIPGYISSANRDYQPGKLTTTTGFRRIVNSDPCISISNVVRIVVQAPVTGNTIFLSRTGGSADTTICNGQVHESLVGSPVTGASYQWLYSTGAGLPTAITGATQVDYINPPALNVSTTYFRTATVGVCTDTTDTGITINVLPPVSNFSISSPQSSVCENTLPEPIDGQSPAGGDGSYVFNWEQSINGGADWTDAAGTHTLSDYQPPVLSQSVIYRRRVTSGLAGCCSVISTEVGIAINPAPAGPVNAGQDAAVYSMDRTYVMTADPPVASGESGFWTSITPSTTIIDNVSDPKTRVRNLSAKNNIFLWTITNGLCSIHDTVTIEIMADFIPQGFSPNGDGFNNTFVIEGLNLEEDIAELNILNGAGTVVYTTTNRSGQTWADWDGRNSKGLELPEGTYYYLLKISGKSGQIIKKSGFVVLKRY